MDSTNPFTQPTHLTDGELAGMFSSGDAREAAFGELVRRHAGMVLRVCRRITGNAQDGEDAAQMVFATLAGRAGELVAARSLAGWLYSTSWHVSRRFRRWREALRRHERQHAAQLRNDGFEADEGAAVVDGADRGGDGAALDEETLAELYRAIEMLPSEYGEAIVLHHLQGMTVQQVSELMGCAVGTTAARLSRGRAMMRERLAWRGVMLSVGGVEAALLYELKREVELATLMHWVHHLPVSLDALVAMSNQGTANTAGAAAVETIEKAAAAKNVGVAGMIAGSAACKWFYAACAAALLFMTTVEAAPVILHAGQSVFHTHMRGEGSASAQTNSAGAVRAESPVAASSGGGAEATVPEPGSAGAIMLLGAAYMTRRGRRTTSVH